MTDKWEGAKFIHFRAASVGAPHYGGATLCYTMIDNDTYLAVAYCHPKDRYTKAHGRARSFGLLNQLICDPVKFNNTNTVYQQTVQYVIKGEPNIPAMIENMGDMGYAPR